MAELLEKKRQIQEQYESKEAEEEITLPFTVSRPEEEATLPFAVPRADSRYSLQDAVNKECSKKEYLTKLENAGKDRFSYFFTDSNETKTLMQGDALTLLCGEYEFHIIDFQGLSEPAVKSEKSFKELLFTLYSVFSGEKMPLLRRHVPSLIEWGILEDKETGEKLGGWYVAKKPDELRCDLKYD